MKSYYSVTRKTLVEADPENKDTKSLVASGELIEFNAKPEATFTANSASVQTFDRFGLV